MERNRHLQFAVLLVLALGVMLLAACTPVERGFAYEWYVATDGDDANACDDPGTPCLTLPGAFTRARATSARVTADHPGEAVSFDHTVHVAAGTYMTGAYGPIGYANFNVRVIGAGQESTIFDSGNAQGRFDVAGDVRVTLRDLTIRNVSSSSPYSCIFIESPAELTMENVTVTHCVGSGILHYSSGDLTLTNVTATNNLLDVVGDGNGLFTNLGLTTIERGSFSNNEGFGISAAGSAALGVSGASIDSNGRDGVSVRDATVSMAGVRITNNGLDGNARAGLFTTGTARVMLTSSHIDDNVFGIWIQDGNVTVTDSVISGNPQVAVEIDDGQIRLTNSIVENNGAYYTGTGNVGGIYIRSDARVALQGSQVRANYGGISNSGVLAMTESSVVDNTGNSLALFNAAGASAVIQQSLIANNQTGRDYAEGGLAVLNNGYINLSNSTLSDNHGYGLLNTGVVIMSYSTIASNTGVGFVAPLDPSVLASIANSLIAGNGVDCVIPESGTIPSLRGMNMDSDGSCHFPETAALAELHLDGLRDNGGPTMTHALLEGSHAIDMARADCPPEDQRNATRPMGGACDLGAYEAGSIMALSLETELDLATVTPTSGGPSILIVVPTKTYNCREGNSTLFEIADTLKQGGEFTPVGIGADKAWFQFEGPTYGQLCWAPAQGFSLYLDGKVIQPDELPDGLLNTVVYPQEPTATPDIDESYDTTPTPTPTCAPNDPKCP